MGYNFGHQVELLGSHKNHVFLGKWEVRFLDPPKSVREPDILNSHSLDTEEFASSDHDVNNSQVFQNKEFVPAQVQADMRESVRHRAVADVVSQPPTSSLPRIHNHSHKKLNHRRQDCCEDDDEPGPN